MFRLTECVFCDNVFRSLRELHGKQTSPTNKRGDLHGPAAVNLHSPQSITINPLSFLKAACLNHSNKTAPNVKLLRYTQFFFFFFFRVVSISSTTTYTVLWCVWVLHLISETWTWGESGVTSIVITAMSTTTANFVIQIHAFVSSISF